MTHIPSVQRWAFTVISLFAFSTSVGADAPKPPPLPEGVKLIADIEYARPDDHPLLLDMYLPEKPDKDLPVILWVHGGGWVAGDRHDRTGIGMAQHGYAVASIDYRLSDVAKFPAQIHDCKAAVRWLRAHAREYHLDPDRIGAWGASAGGHLVALLGTTGDNKDLEGDEGNLQFSSRIQAVCDWFGPTDFVTIGKQAAEMPFPAAIPYDTADSFFGKLIGGAPPEHQDKAKAASPVTYVSEDDPPFLIMQGDKDTLVPAAQSEELRDVLKKAGVPVTLEIIKGAGHGFGGPQIMEKVQKFFDENLKKDQKPASDSGK